jgi:membrane-associated phospholipid phosphatase
VDPEIPRAAQTLADHAILLLALGIGLLAVAVLAVFGAARFVRRHQEILLDVWTWIFARLRRFPFVGTILGRAREMMPTSYVVLHLALGLLAIGAVAGFGIIAEEVFAGESVAAFDVAFAEALRNSASPRWHEVFRTITWFGSAEVLVPASAMIGAGLLIRRHYVLAIGWIIGLAGGAALNMILKSAFARSRPESASIFASGWSFPSGHAMSTFVFCGLGAYLLLRFTRSWGMSAIVVGASFAWCVLMGFTRLYLGVHYASDVLAGLIAATAWVAVCISGIELGLRRMKRAGVREQPRTAVSGFSG